MAAYLLDPLLNKGDFDFTREGLDALSPNNPVIIMESNGHVGHVNSRAY